jgi:Cu+-exporting ATPase
MVLDGTVKCQVENAAKDSILANIINLVKRAQSEKPPVQQLADKISAIFVPVVIGIALFAFVINFFVLNNFTSALMRSIAVLVIACPCAMGLATPAAIAVGLGRAAKSGILFRHARSLEDFKDISQTVFDKTGTLTRGNFLVADYQFQNVSAEEFKCIAHSIEKYSNHPIAKSIAAEWKQKDDMRWVKIEEIKGLGMQAESREGDFYQAGSYKIVSSYINDDSHNVYITKNNILIGWIDVADEIRPEALAVVRYLKNKNIKTILLSGDSFSKCKLLADQLGIDEIIAGQTPEQKLQGSPN